MATWPNSLPAKPKSGTFTFGPQPNVVEFVPDVGRPQRSKRYALSRQIYAAQMDLNTEQVAVLMAFFEDDCASGVESFFMPDWIGGATKTFTWVEPPQPQHIAGEDWIVSLALAREN